MNKKIFLPLLTSLLGFILVVPASLAEPQVLAESFVFTPKTDKVEEFEKALKKHAKHRNELEDPWKWRMYSPVLGDDLDKIAVRTFGFGWADKDTYREWSMKKNPQKHWNKNVDKYVANYAHYMSVIDKENSHWGPDVEYKYVGVTTYKIKMGHRSAVNEDKKIMSEAAKANNWPFNWEWSEAVSGSGVLMLAVPYKNWASMEPGETKFAEVLAKHLGSEDKAKEMFERWSSHFESVGYDLYALRDDLMN